MQTLIDAVQHNCDIVDARHGTDYGMCTYLLKMRERYRWERGLPLGAPLGREAVGDWLSTREAHLEALEQADFRTLEIDGATLDPFDAEAVNDALGSRRLAYSAGLVHGGRPHFFLAELEGERRAESGFVLRVTGRELARCLNAPPAMTRGSTIFLRRESLRRFLWEKYESWLWSRSKNAMARAVACYPFDHALDQALDAMTEAEMASIEAHERGEYQAGLDLGDAWESMLMDIGMTPAELMARAVRDHLADCTHTLPTLLGHDREASLHFFIANLGAMRRQLFPALEVAYDTWLVSGDTTPMGVLAGRAADHWRGLALQMLDLHRRFGERAAGKIAALVEQSTL
ncbi:MAG: hypothetical protein KDJ33_15655 [Gammaproteobacteria bacterium]|nr:hypothetical protein [Gammaproteobacteria bacterium]